MSHAASVNKSIKGDVILDKAKSFAQLLGINDFKGSNVRNSEVIRRSPEELINLERKKLQDIIKNYPLEDVFNCNEFVPVGGSIGENVEGSDIDSSTEITEIASKAIKLCSEAWNLLSVDMIKNCWIKTRIFPQTESYSTENQIINAAIFIDWFIQQEENHLQLIIHQFSKLGFTDLMTAQEYIMFDNDILNDNDFIEIMFDQKLHDHHHHHELLHKQQKQLHSITPPISRTTTTTTVTNSYY
ncbi:24240_t:CDS:2 [Entrophospora sp. SA101]|nr:24240_t:CDS:2 [Entrophospora sp. SA101]